MMMQTFPIRGTRRTPNGVRSAGVAGVLTD